MKFKGGYAGRILSVDLTRKKFVKKPLSKELVESYTGGRGFTSKIQYEKIDEKIEPLSPENLLIFAVGPLTGTTAPCSGRFVVGGRSPLTGILGDSNCGGFWGPELKFSGYDMIVLTGKSKEPVYLWIYNDQVEIRDANHIWGKDTLETERLIKTELGDEKIQIASIGQGGEKIVRFACIMAGQGNAAGRSGMGAIMGYKGLKAVAVRGTRTIDIAQPKGFRAAVEKALKVLKNDLTLSVVAPRLGTTRWLTIMNEAGGLATRNWQTGIFEGAQQICGETMYEKYVTGTRGCYACPIRCKRFTHVKEGPFKGPLTTGPEYFALVSFGSKCGNNNLESILKANELVNKYGIDVGGTGGVIGFAMECYEKGILTEKDTEGLNLEWGNYNSILELIRKIALRRGFGDVLADGTRAAAEKIGKGSERYAIHVKGMDLVTVDPRCFKAYNLRYAIATRGACHLRLQASIVREPLDEMPIHLVGEKLSWWENLMASIDSLGICKFLVTWNHSYRAMVRILSELYSSATGIKINEADLVERGERITNVEKLFNLKLGLTHKDDVLPKRFLEEPLPEGPKKGHVFDNFFSVRSAYYKARDWDGITGVPKKEKLRHLGLGVDNVQ